jgi:electron transfer flavoprotein alpha subunit
MAGNVWILVEQWKGEISEITWELLALGRELADGLGTSLEAVLLGHGAKEKAASLAGFDKVIYGDHESLAEATGEGMSQILVDLMQERQPACLMVPLTNVTADIAGLLPAELQAPFLNSCRDVRVVDGKLQARCLLYGGKMEATVTPTELPAILGILPGSRPAEKPAAAIAPEVEEIAVAIPDAPRVKFLKFIDPEAGDVDITQQDVLVAIGRGIQTEDNVELAQELADTLGGAVCGSRPVIDQGWLPLSRQVGKSGALVKPKLYVVAGVSGAPEHVEGMKGGDLIVAVNTDPEAPIFQFAHFGIVGDALEVLPALTEAVRARKG